MTSARHLLGAWQLRAKKRLGQHFLRAPEAGRNLVLQSGVGEGDRVLEIGAGLGALTIPLAERARRVIAVERDLRLVGLLRAELLAAGCGHVHIVAADVLTMDLARMAGALGGPLTVAGNLPYNISSQILIRLVEVRGFVQRAVLMFQKELAERILSPPSQKTYGRLTVMVNYCADVTKLQDLKAADFFPQPKIDSTVLEIRFREPRPEKAVDEARLFRLVQAAFGQRRKMLKNALAATGEFETDRLAAAFSETGISGERRAETLTVQEFVRLGNHLFGLTNPQS